MGLTLCALPDAAVPASCKGTVCLPWGCFFFRVFDTLKHIYFLFCLISDLQQRHLPGDKRGVCSYFSPVTRQGHFPIDLWLILPTNSIPGHGQQ